MRTIPDIRPRVDSIPLADPRIDAGKASGVKAKSRPLNRLEGARQYILHGDHSIARRPDTDLTSGTSIYGDASAREQEDHQVSYSNALNAIFAASELTC